MNEKQVKWASQHNWFIYAQYENGTLYVQGAADVYDDNGNIVEIDCIYTNDINELREWAGY